MPNLIKSSGILTENDRDKAEDLNKYFKGVFIIEDLASTSVFDIRNGESLVQDIEINEALVLKQLENLKVNISPGSDGFYQARSSRVD